MVQVSDEFFKYSELKENKYVLKIFEKSQNKGNQEIKESALGASIYNPNTLEVETRGLGVQGHPWLQK